MSGFWQVIEIFGFYLTVSDFSGKEEAGWQAWMGRGSWSLGAHGFCLLLICTRSGYEKRKPLLSFREPSLLSLGCVQLTALPRVEGRELPAWPVRHTLVTVHVEAGS